MRVCSFCGEKNEDWMELCQRCGNSIANANTIEYKAVKRPQPKFINTMDDVPEIKEKKPRENMDLKIILFTLSLILIGLIAYTIYVMM